MKEMEKRQGKKEKREGFKEGVRTKNFISCTIKTTTNSPFLSDHKPPVPYATSTPKYHNSKTKQA